MLTKIEEKYVQKLEKEPDNQYGIQSFGKTHLKKITQPMILNTERSRKYRKNIYGALNDIELVN
ncbi:hypothetical protein [Borreliella garinii]|uniref:hypothetical protein n=1 Tax=Borreliella garinii TaxID=29519 RepID=UPI0004D5AEAC|nr:hypothetical protein [Borreliella garinii]KEO61896.1 hypothetical protein DM10_05325 [Borreliella garinii]